MERASERIAKSGQDSGGFNDVGTKGFEGFGSEPNAVFGGIDVGEEAQNARAISGASGKRIEMKQIVAGVETGGATFSFDGTEAGVMEFPFAGVGRKEL